MLRILIDAMGGDNAPEAIIDGCLAAVARMTGFDILLLGDSKNISSIINARGYSGGRINIKHTSQVINGSDVPTKVIKEKKDSSIVVGLNMIRTGDGDSFLSCGNTGALLTGALLLTGRLAGVDRPALAPLIPTAKGGTMLIDAGLNSSCKPINYQQFAEIGSIYMKEMFKISKPRVGLINVGSEENKGTETVKEAYQRLKALDSINFIGNVEGRELTYGACDVAVCDGFVGNVVLKCIEGVGYFIIENVIDILKKNAKSKIAATLIKKDVKAFFKRLDYESYGGAPILGIRGSVFKGHGSSNANAVMHAIDAAVAFGNSSVYEQISEKFAEKGMSGEHENGHKYDDGR